MKSDQSQRKKLKARLKRLEAEIDMWISKRDESDAVPRPEIQQQIDALQAKRDEVKRRLDALASTSQG